MAEQPKFVDDVPVGRIFLYLENPRHNPVETEERAIAQLCEKEEVYPLARDIVKHGLNPLERFALVPLGADKGGKNSNYSSAEGNRRICALKLLNDPERAPANLRKAFQKLVDDWGSPIKSVHAAVFDEYEDARIWLDRTHNGPQGGIGRRQWNADQKQRFDGGAKNRAAQQLLDYAEQEKMITREQRVGKLTTVQRFVGNDVFSEMLGFESGPEEPTRTRPKEEFDILLRRFIGDLLGKKHVNSRMNKEAVIKYARPLASLPGVSTARIEAEGLSTTVETKRGSRSRRQKPKKPEKARHVRYEQEINTALSSLGNDKLLSLYHSICSVELEQHTPLVAVGTWSFFEILTACAGRKDTTSFDSFLSNDRLKSLGITPERALREAMERIRNYGNTTKHHPVAALFNGDQLNNDIIALKGVILKCIGEAATKQGA
jgi:hypothetical protein